MLLHELIKNLWTKAFNKDIVKGSVSLQTIQLSIGTNHFYALLDNGPTVSLIPLTLLRQVGLEVAIIKGTYTTLSFTGRHQDEPYGTIKEIRILLSGDLELVHSCCG